MRAPLAALALIALTAGCGSTASPSKRSAPAPGSLESLWRNSGESVSLIPGTSDYSPGKLRISFLVVDPRGRVVAPPRARVWVAHSLRAKPFAEAVAQLEPIGIPGVSTGGDAGGFGPAARVCRRYGRDRPAGPGRSTSRVRARERARHRTPWRPLPSRRPVSRLAPAARRPRRRASHAASEQPRHARVVGRPHVPAGRRPGRRCGACRASNRTCPESARHSRRSYATEIRVSPAPAHCASKDSPSSHNRP